MVGVVAGAVFLQAYCKAGDGTSGQPGEMYAVGVIGIVALVTGVVIILMSLHSTRTIDGLVKTGCYVMADITAMPVDRSVSINGMPAYRIECAYTDRITGIEYVFRSRTFFIDPSRAITKDKVRVYVDPERGYKKYLVDVESILHYKDGRDQKRPQS